MLERLCCEAVPISCSTLTVFSAKPPHKTRGSSDARPPPTRLPLQIPCCGLRLRTCGFFLSRLMLSPVSPVSNHSRNMRHGRQEYRDRRLQLVIIPLQHDLKHVHMQRGERLLWLDHRDDIIDHTHFLGPTDPESFHDTCDHFENMTLSRKLH